MSERHLARARVDIRKRLRRDLFFLSPLLVIAGLLGYFLYFDGWLHGQPGRTRNTSAQVIDIVPANEGGEVLVHFVYLDLAGDPHEASREYETRPALEPGDEVEFSYVVGHEETARPKSEGDRLQRLLLGSLFALVLFALLALLAYCLHRFHKRRYLLVHGRREPGHGARIETTQFTFKGNTQPMWRLVLKRFEPAQAAWIECRSEWQAGEAPILAPDTELPPILVDPRDPGRFYLPTGDLGPDHFWKA